MIFEAEGVVFLAIFVFWLWALYDAITVEAEECRNLPKALWVILVFALFDLGAILWVALGRPKRRRWLPGTADYSADRRPVGVEDDPRYTPSPAMTDRRSQELDRRLAEWEQEHKSQQVADELTAREAELERREQELRRRELELREADLRRREGELG